MRAWFIDSFTGVEHLRLTEVADPAPAAGEALIDLHFAALNPADRYLAQGEYPAKPPLPHVMGRDGVGKIAALGEGVSNFAVGQRVTILRGDTGVSRWGAFADRVVVDVDSLVLPPDEWSDQEAAGAALVYLTAYQALTQWADLPPNAIILITGASGGVGVASLHLAKAMGYRVIALSRDPVKQGNLREIGADVVLSPEDPQWRKAARDALGGRRVDLAIDNIGGPGFGDLIDTLAHEGRVSAVGRLAGPVPQFNTASLFFRRAKIGGVAVSSFSRLQAQEAWQDIIQLLASAGVRPLVDSVFPFDQLPQAFARLKQGPMGKVLLQVRG